MELAKNHLDVGLFTNSLEPMLEFWQQQVGLPFEEVLATGGGSQQHRHAFGGGVLKINHVRDLLAEAPPPDTGSCFSLGKASSSREK